MLGTLTPYQNIWFVNICPTLQIVFSFSLCSLVLISLTYLFSLCSLHFCVTPKKSSPNPLWTSFPLLSFPFDWTIFFCGGVLLWKIRHIDFSRGVKREVRNLEAFLLHVCSSFSMYLSRRSISLCYEEGTRRRRKPPFFFSMTMYTIFIFKVNFSLFS